MRFDIDTYKEITNTLTRNKSRSVLTGFGIFWGVFMLIFLIGGGQGLRDMLESNFEGFAQNTSMIWAQPTSKPYKGMKKERVWNMTLKDVEHLRSRMPQLETVVPQVFAGWKKVANGENSTECSIIGVLPEQKDIEMPQMKYGRFLNETDIRERRKVCVIGKEVYEILFPEGGNPCGKAIRVDSTYMHIVGVDMRNAGGIQINGSSAERISIPYPTVCTIYNRGNNVDVIAICGKRGVSMSREAQKMRAIIAREHNIAPDDELGIMIFNTEAFFALVENLFKGVNFLIWLVGLGTLLAGAIGVSNIMMVTVKERTTEIGIRRAIGASPRMILSQIMMESIILTALAGMGGILFGILLLQLFETGTMNTDTPAHFQIDFWMAVFSTLLLCLLGGLAGLAPAWRALKIKPVDAMHDDG